MNALEFLRNIGLLVWDDLCPSILSTILTRTMKTYQLQKGELLGRVFVSENHDSQIILHVRLCGRLGTLSVLGKKFVAVLGVFFC